MSDWMQGTMVAVSIILSLFNIFYDIDIDERTKNKIGKAVILLSPVVSILAISAMAHYENAISIVAGLVCVFAWLWWGVSWGTYAEGVD